MPIQSRVHEFAIATSIGAGGSSSVINCDTIDAVLFECLATGAGDITFDMLREGVWDWLPFQTVTIPAPGALTGYRIEPLPKTMRVTMPAGVSAFTVSATGRRKIG